MKAEHVSPPLKHLGNCLKSEPLWPESPHGGCEVDLGKKESLVLNRFPATPNCRTRGRILTCAERSKVASVWIPLTLLPWPLSVIANIPVYFCSWSLPDIRRELVSQMLAPAADL